MEILFLFRGSQCPCRDPNGDLLNVAIYIQRGDGVHLDIYTSYLNLVFQAYTLSALDLGPSAFRFEVSIDVRARMPMVECFY